MSKVKLCGLSREVDIEAVNELLPDYIGFVFFKKSKRYVSPERAAELKKLLDPRIKAVGVFVNEDVNAVAELINCGTIDIAQIHGSEDEDYIASLRALTKGEIIQAFKIKSVDDVKKAEASSAEYILLDSGAGTGSAFDWSLLKDIRRPYFLAGGLDTVNVSEAVDKLNPYACDVSSGIETDGLKDRIKMAAFVKGARKE